MSRDLRLYLEDIWESMEKIEEYLRDLTQEDFFEKSSLQDAVIRRLSMIGEAARSIPEEFRQKYPDIPWKRIVGIRNIIIHEYFGVNLERIWEVAKNDLPALKPLIARAREDLTRTQ